MNEIEIKRITLEHIDAVYEAVRESINEAHQWLPWCHPDYTKQETVNWVTYQMSSWNNDEEYSFVILEKGTGKLLGGIGLNFINNLHKVCNLGYWVRTSCTGKGVATKAVKLAVEYAINELNFNRVEIIISKDNIASQKVAEKAGAVKECLAKKRLLIHGVPTDSFVYSLIKE
jgi:ribosomal-protein-serine acetyltransferase